MVKRILLVEGKDDEHVLKHLCWKCNLPHLDEIKPLESVEKLLDHIPVRLRAEIGSDAIVGIIIDADTDLAARWQSLRNRLAQLEYTNLPNAPLAVGTILDPPSGSLLPRVGLWIMPSNQTTGNLEDFLKFLVPENSELFRHVESSIETIPSDQKRFEAKDDLKAMIYTWLAWQKAPGKPLGTAITAGFLDHTAPEADVLISWLTRLFFPENN